MVILVWVLIAFLVVLLATLAYKALVSEGRAPIRRSRSEPFSGPEVVAAFKQRYARGEIDEEEFERRRATLVRGRR